MIKVLVDKSISDCAICPLKPSFTWDCGKVSPENYNGAVAYRKKPDKRCKLFIKNQRNKGVEQ